MGLFLGVLFLGTLSLGALGFQAGDAIAQLLVLLLGRDHVEGQFFDFGEQLGLHFAEADAFLLDFLGGGDVISGR